MPSPMLPRHLLGSLVLAVATIAPLSGCTSFYDLRYMPAPLEVALTDEATPKLSGRALVAVTAVRRPDQGRPAQFELVMRLENLGDMPFRIDPDSIQLVSADLAAMGPVQISPPPTELPPEKTTMS